jgi:hypothetical protein
VALILDACAMHLLAHQRPGQALVITLTRRRGGGLPMEMLTIRWDRVSAAERKAHLEQLDVQQGVPIYVHRRLAIYARWHALPITARRLAWWRYFEVDRELEVWHNLVQWERSHPGLGGHVPRPT